MNALGRLFSHSTGITVRSRVNNLYSTMFLTHFVCSGVVYSSIVNVIFFRCVSLNWLVCVQ